MPSADNPREAELAAAYAAVRARLLSVAYAVLGSHSEAEDVVSECWLRLIEADRKEPVFNVEAWATVTVAHAALDVLRSARHRREIYTGPWLPEPIVGYGEVSGTHGRAEGDPAERVSLDACATPSWWSWRPSAQRSGPRGCCTTCLGCHSTRSLRPWAVVRSPSVNSPPAPVATSRPMLRGSM